MKYKYLVSIRLMTFNHSEFIIDALEGINKQKTNFIFEVVIGDDFSTDDNLKLINQYKFTNRNLRVNILERKVGDNYWIKRQKLGRIYNFTNIIENCSSKYIALLDGDDYWTDPLKLQKQVDFLEKNGKVVLTFSNIKILDETGNYHRKGIYPNGIPNTIYSPAYIYSLATPTQTMVFRNNVEFPNWFHNVQSGDVFLRLLLSLKGDVYFHGDIFGVHRKHAEGLSQTNNKLKWNLNSAKYLTKFLKMCLEEQVNPINKEIITHYNHAFFLAYIEKDWEMMSKILSKMSGSKYFYTKKGLGVFKFLFTNVVIKKNHNMLNSF